MPFYEYRRPDGSTFEVMQKMVDPSLTHDPDTGVEVTRVFHPIAVHFKGKGFYNTDYGTKKRQAEKAAENASDGAKKSSGDGAKGDGGGSDTSSSGKGEKSASAAKQESTSSSGSSSGSGSGSGSSGSGSSSSGSSSSGSSSSGSSSSSSD
ncbi:MAG: FmdB family transcriptional regulator [Solirubrobacterales bacterium]|nr:FmdB family transcriptional regulator [Solirubrobacterales bacterium]